MDCRKSEKIDFTNIFLNTCSYISWTACSISSPSCPSFQSQIAMDLTADLDSDACNSRKLLQDLATFKKNFPTMQHVFSTGNGPLKDHLQVPSSSAAAEAMLTEPPLLSDADHCTAITAARAQLKDKEKAVDLIQQILQNQNILIDGGVIQRTALKPSMDGLKTAEAALAEATKRALICIFRPQIRDLTCDLD
ncbi:hypothetical protein CDAR_614551 [Caerostris darwini]|uniref:Uncharacterized protein n=1 Tax=Caerostris darwini TaxID=1538125 RepID=A0AAV4WHP1_9ARAC|nr:hypothetical protein CDAR_614551 [Caerostris darwini]